MAHLSQSKSVKNGFFLASEKAVNLGLQNLRFANRKGFAIVPL